MSFLNTTVTLEAFAPDLSTPLIDAQTAVVGAGEEFSDIAQYDIPTDFFLTVNGDIDIGADTIDYTVDDTRFPGFADVDDENGFNGLVWTFDLPDTRISGVEFTRDDLNNITENLFFNANSIFMDVDGLPFQNGDTGTISVTFGDPDGTLESNENAIYTARLYSAAFGREPDQDGLNFWIDNFGEVGEVGMSEFFLGSPEFQDRFGDPVALSDGAYLDVLYNNILGRNGDEAGVTFWSEVLADDLASRAEVLSFFVTSDENVDNTPELENVAISAVSGDWFILA